MVSEYLLFHLFTIFARFTHGPKNTRLNKIHISTRKSSLSQGNFCPRWINTLVHILMDTIYDSLVCFTILTNNICSNPSPRIMVLFLLVPIHLQENAKRGRVKGDRHKPRSFYHKGKHKIGFYPKYLLMFATYQLKGWCAIILSVVKA